MGNDLLDKLRALNDGVARPVTTLEREVCGEAADLLELGHNPEKYVAEIREDELSLRIYQAVRLTDRPPGATAAQALTTIDPQIVSACRRAAAATMDYWRECLKAAASNSVALKVDKGEAK